MSAESSAWAADPLDNGTSPRQSFSSGPDLPNEAHVADDPVDDTLPPIDGGIEAWKVVFGAWFVEALLWGYPLSYGIFQSYYSHNPPFQDSKSLAVIGNLTTGISSLLLPLVSPFIFRYPRYQLHAMWAGWAICITALLLASYVTRVWHLMLTQGVLYGVGWVVCYTPLLLITNGWFVKRRGIVYGILFGASGVSGMVLPFLLETLLKRFGFRLTLRLMALAVVLISGPPFLLVRPRAVYPPNLRSGSSGLSDYGFVKSWRFVAFATSVAFQGVGFFFPHIFLPSFARSLGLGAHRGAALIALNSVAQVCGQITMGHISDKVDVHIPLGLSPLLSGTAVLLLWGPAKSFLPLAAFPLIYGFFGASYSVLWSRVAMYLTPSPEVAVTIFGTFSMERGTANVLAGPISAWLLGDEVVAEDYALRKYKGVVLFVGCSMLVSSTVGLRWFWRTKEGSETAVGNVEDRAARGSYELLAKRPKTSSPGLDVRHRASSSELDFEIEVEEPRSDYYD